MGAETRTAIDKAYTAQAGWAALTPGAQGHALALASADQDHTDDLAAILTAEIGKPLAEAKVGGLACGGISAMVCQRGQPHPWRDDLPALD
ncbi:aldehyde dehydrogenase family protein [Mesorhizobium erdmanii]|uniref:aldehyde dehydrogenase family protein n=1 Tax=Mesorhizobium erdmanii TaxID=1777866 RepID=UPI0023428B0C|nr:aldehyde dehydrogenase family protein [Mesorhizobium erdmanii]